MHNVFSALPEHNYARLKHKCFIFIRLFRDHTVTDSCSELPNSKECKPNLAKQNHATGEMKALHCCLEAVFVSVKRFSESDKQKHGLTFQASIILPEPSVIFVSVASDFFFYGDVFLNRMITLIRDF